MQMNRLKTLTRRGMTLIELMIVVTILAILAAIVIPTFSNAQQEAAVASAATSMRAYAESCMRYKLDHDDWPPTAPGGHGFNNALDPYISKADRLIDTPAGGYWAYHDWGTGNRSLISGERYTVGVLIARADDSSFQEIDALIDDGNLSTGTVQQYNRYGYTNLVWVLE